MGAPPQAVVDLTEDSQLVALESSSGSRQPGFAGSRQPDLQVNEPSHLDSPIFGLDPGRPAPLSRAWSSWDLGHGGFAKQLLNDEALNILSPSLPIHESSSASSVEVISPLGDNSLLELQRMNGGYFCDSSVMADPMDPPLGGWLQPMLSSYPTLETTPLALDRSLTLRADVEEFDASHFQDTLVDPPSPPSAPVARELESQQPVAGAPLEEWEVLKELALQEAKQV